MAFSTVFIKSFSIVSSPMNTPVFSTSLAAFLRFSRKRNPGKSRVSFLCLQNTASKTVFRLVIKVWSDFFVIHVCRIIPVSSCRNIFKFLSVCCCCKSVYCVVSHHQRRLCNCSEECSVLNSCFDDRTSIETNTDNIACCCVRSKNEIGRASCRERV